MTRWDDPGDGPDWVEVADDDPAEATHLLVIPTGDVLDLIAVAAVPWDSPDPAAAVRAAIDGFHS